MRRAGCESGADPGPADPRREGGAPGSRGPGGCRCAGSEPAGRRRPGWGWWCGWCSRGVVVAGQQRMVAGGWQAGRRLRMPASSALGAVVGVMGGMRWDHARPCCAMGPSLRLLGALVQPRPEGAAQGQGFLHPLGQIKPALLRSGQVDGDVAQSGLVVVIDRRVQREEDTVVQRHADATDRVHKRLIDRLHDRFGAQPQGPQRLGGAAIRQDRQELFAPADHLDRLRAGVVIHHAEGTTEAAEQFWMGQSDDPLRSNADRRQLIELLLLVLSGFLGEVLQQCEAMRRIFQLGDHGGEIAGKVSGIGVILAAEIAQGPACVRQLT